jgi:hypothetical protein
MRFLIVERLTQYIKDSGEFGIPAYFDCDEDEMIGDPEILKEMSDEELLEVYDATVGFQG